MCSNSMGKTLIYTVLFAVLYCSFSPKSYAQNAAVISEFVFPIQTDHVHASSIIELPNEDLLICWFQGSGERTANDVRIMGARLVKGETIWSEPFLLADTPGQPDCNPVLFINQQQELFLFWIVVQANKWERSILKYRTSSDYLEPGSPDWDWQDIILLKPGDEFEEEIAKKFNEFESRNLVWAEYAPRYEKMILAAAADKSKKETGWMSRIHPIILFDGRILLPLYSDGFNMSIMALSDDNGISWTSSLPLVGYGNIQPSILQKKDGSLLAFMRDNGDAPGRVLTSRSTDNGKEWTRASKSSIPNPGSSVEVLGLQNGDCILVYNDLEQGRNRLVISLSDDEGETWKWSKYLEFDETEENSYSYPSVIQGKDAYIHISYSFHKKDKKTIKHVRISQKWLKSKN